jgi:biopolymer transport protein ExbD
MPVTIPSPSTRKRARIEIIPLIDIIFFLLATFVIVSLSMVKNKGIPVNLPGASTAQPQDRKDFASISITEKGELYFNKESVTPPQLEQRLRELLAQNSEPKVFINGDAKAEFGQAVAALDLVRRLGITKIAIETKNSAAPVPVAAGFQPASATGFQPGGSNPSASSTQPAPAQPATPPQPAPASSPAAPPQ